MKVKDLQAELARFNPDSNITANLCEIDCIVGQPASHRLDIECGRNPKDEEEIDKLENAIDGWKSDVKDAEGKLESQIEENAKLGDRIEELEKELEELKK